MSKAKHGANVCDLKFEFVKPKAQKSNEKKDGYESFVKSLNEMVSAFSTK